MKKKLMILALVCASFLGSTLAVYGKVVRENRKTEAFRKLSSGGGIDVYFTQGDSYSLVVEADEDDVDNITTKVEDGTLVIGWKKKKIISVLSNRVMKVHVSAPTLDNVSISGGSDFHADKLDCDDSFQLSASGGADVEINSLTAGKTGIAVSGGADVEINSMTVAGTTAIAVSGGADCEIKKLKTGECNLSAAGAGDLNLNVEVSGNLKVVASGAADIDLSGKANDVRLSAVGGADINVKKLSYSTIDILKSGGGDVSR